MAVAVCTLVLGVPVVPAEIEPSAAGHPTAARAVALDTKAIDQVLGRSGELKGDVYKVGFPRTDLHVVADGVQIKPGLALGSWMAFERMGDHAMAMGDLVLLQSEINPVLAKLEANGIEISAIHNHLLGDEPHVMYMHFMGHGDEAALARTLEEALALSATPMGAPAAATPASQTPNPTFTKIQETLGVQGKEKGGVLQIGVPRREKIMTADGMEVPAFMGTAIAINFQESPKGVATTGDFVLVAGEVNPVIRELERGGIEITALHSHMLDENPRLFFMHFWGNGDPETIARALKAALGKTNVGV
jgi:hypothetical protein